MIWFRVSKLEIKNRLNYFGSAWFYLFGSVSVHYFGFNQTPLPYMQLQQNMLVSSQHTWSTATINYAKSFLHISIFNFTLIEKLNKLFKGGTQHIILHCVRGLGIVIDYLKTLTTPNCRSKK